MRFELIGTLHYAIRIAEDREGLAKMHSVICFHNLRFRRSEASGDIISSGFQPDHQPLAEQPDGLCNARQL